MAHFAKIDENNVVLTVLGVNDEDCLNSDGVEEEAIGQAHLEKHNNWPAHLWIQTSYNTRINQHALGGTPFRGNYASPGYTWDAANDCFWEIKPHSSWVKDIPNKRWKAPKDEPSESDGWHLFWSQEDHEADSTKGWRGLRDDDTQEIKTPYKWNGTAWVNI